MLTASGPGGRGVGPARARALIVAAIRETFEETGLVIGQPAKPAPAGPGAWEAFARAGLAPDAGGLVYFARAITPPGLRHRFDTRFFLCEEAAISATLAPASDELEGITWCTPAAAKAGRIAGITALIVDVVEAIAEGRRAPGEVTVFAPGRQLGLVVPVA
jgi:8-oxo-dGTP pyrophosphatase MutT (NUDIX family)